MAGITIDGVSKIFGKTPALKEISLDVRDGEFMVLLGPSGCGKTTLLRCVAGLEQVNGGHVPLGDGEVTDPAPRQPDIATGFQDYAALPHTTAGSNNRVRLRMKPRRQTEVHKR